jgi:hypothetical protein
MGIPNRVADAPVLSWGDGPAAARTYIQIDCIPTFSDARGGTITDFAIEDGTSVADHFIRKPQVITFEVNQTETPIDAAQNNLLGPTQFAWETVTLKPQPNAFQASGLLLGMSALSGVVSAGLGAIGVPGFGETPTYRTHVLTSSSDAERINELYDALTKAYEGAKRFNLSWLGRQWEDLVIESVTYTRGARQLGVFSLSMKKITVVKTEVASALAVSPATFSMKLPIDLGNKPGVGFADIEADIAAKSLIETTPSLLGAFGL